MYNCQYFLVIPSIIYCIMQKVLPTYNIRRSYLRNKDILKNGKKQ